LVDPKDNGGLTREDLRMGMAEDNIECRPLWKPMHMQPVFREVPFYTAEGKVQDENGKASVCGDLFEKGLCLLSGSYLIAEDWERIGSKLGELLSKALD
jgi:dTDP-4-amino-4,6-dideoxygalactose transaminase